VFRGDEPITKASDDALGRSLLAKEIAKLIRGFDIPEGVVVGVFGPWGSGKTSLINMIEEALSGADPIPVLRFNPWMFSGTDQLVERFFSETSQQLGRRPQAAVKGIARNLELYGKVLSPLKGVPIAGALVAALEGIPQAAEAFHDLIEEQEGGAINQREKLTEALSKLDKPIAVVIDDIDRLTPGEVRDILKLVRLTGSFPKIVYVLAFDRVRVESILSEPGV
jgi:predicted KAP-like P-loop ATPase